MRILFTFAGGTGHFLPLVPLARAAEAAGHVVAFAGQEPMVAAVEAEGFVAFASGGDTLLAPDKRTPLREYDAEREARTLRVTFAGRVARYRADALLAMCGEWLPDAVVCEEIDFGAMVAAERLGLPHARVLCLANTFVPAELVAGPLNELRAHHGLPRDSELAMLGRDLVLSPFPPSLRHEHGAHAFRSVVPVAAPAPPWLEALPEARTVYFTLGTIFSLESGDLFERVIEGLSALPVNVVVTVGRDIDPLELGPQPPNVHVERYVPQSLLLPHCSLVVSHAGSGSVIGALAHGLPTVLLPLGADQPLNAARCEELDVARVLDPIEASPDDVRDAAIATLEDPRYRRSAERIRDEIAALPGAGHGVALIEMLIP